MAGKQFTCSHCDGHHITKNKLLLNRFFIFNSNLKCDLLQVHLKSEHVLVVSPVLEMGQIEPSALIKG